MYKVDICGSSRATDVRHTDSITRMAKLIQTA